MTMSTPSEAILPDPVEDAETLIEDALSRAGSGDYDAAIEDLVQAELVAHRAGLDELVRTSRINQGYVFTMQGDTDSAIETYGEAAELCRAADDTPRLTLTLANLSVVLGEQSRHSEAIATLTEYLELLGDEDASQRARGHLNRAMHLLRVDDHVQAVADLDAAEEAAGEAGDDALAYAVHMGHANVYLEENDYPSARLVLEKAVNAAHATGDSSELQRAISALAQTFRMLGQNAEADKLFATVEDRYRDDENTEALADSLYWHGTVLRAIRQHTSALDKWREEEAIRRRLEQPGHLAECLLAQADALRAIRDNEAAEPLYREACEIFERHETTDMLSDALYGHGMSLRSLGRSREALTRAEEAARYAAQNGDGRIESRAHNLRAMVLADLGDYSAAREAIDCAESVCLRSELHSTLVWTLARQAYVLAREGAEPQEVVAQLQKAHLKALIHEQADAARAAVRKLGAEIVAECGERYQEPIDVFRREQLAELRNIADTGMPYSVAAMPADSIVLEPTGEAEDTGESADEE